MTRYKNGKVKDLVAAARIEHGHGQSSALDTGDLDDTSSRGVNLLNQVGRAKLVLSERINVRDGLAAGALCAVSA